MSWPHPYGAPPGPPEWRLAIDDLLREQREIGAAADSEWPNWRSPHYGASLLRRILAEDMRRAAAARARAEFNQLEQLMPEPTDSCRPVARPDLRGLAVAARDAGAIELAQTQARQAPVRRLRALQFLSDAAPVAVSALVLTRLLDDEPDIDTDAETVHADLEYLARVGFVRLERAQIIEAAGPILLARLQIAGACFLSGSGVTVAEVATPAEAMRACVADVCDPAVDTWLPDEG